MTVCVTGATGFIGGHVARLERERGELVRVTFRDEARLSRLGDLDVEPVKADVLDRAGMRRALRGCDLLHHMAGYVGARPAERVWQVNALSPRIAVEAAAAEDVPRVDLTSSVAGIGPVPPGEVGDEETVFGAGGLDMTYVDSKHEGEAQALAAGARLGVEVVIVNPSYVLGVPVDPYQAGETSTRVVGNFMLGKLPAVVDGSTNVVDVEDVAAGHLLAAEKGKPGERYVLGGYNLGWVELIDRLAEASGKRRPLLVLPREVARLAQVQGDLGLPSPIAPEAFALMAQNWRASSRKAKRELGYRTRPLERTVQATVDWYRDLIESGTITRSGRTPMTVAAAGMRVGDRIGLFGALRAAEGYVGRRLVAGS